MSNEDPIAESAKAVQEVAKATSKAINAGEKVGSFLSRYMAGSLEQAMGIFEDKLKYMRWERQLHFMQRAEQLLKSIGLNHPTKPIPLKLAVPLFEAASLEDDDFLQELWARLLVNAANAASGIDLQRAYISILEQLTPLEAVVLERIYALPYEKTQYHGVVVGGLPHEVRVRNELERDGVLSEPPDEVKLALANLARLGCISITKSWVGGEIFSTVIPTLLGKSFVEACTLHGEIKNSLG